MAKLIPGPFKKDSPKLYRSAVFKFNSTCFFFIFFSCALQADNQLFVAVVQMKSFPFFLPYLII